MENKIPYYMSYPIFQNSFVPSINLSYEAFENISLQIYKQNQEIIQLKKENQDLKALIKEHQNAKQVQILKQKNSLESKDHQAVGKKFKPDRTFYCDYDNCDRVYASTLALNLHIKTKHNGGTKKQRDAYAKLIVMAQLNGQSIPQINFNFPKNCIQNFKQKLLTEQNFHKKQIQEIPNTKKSISQ